MAATWWAGSSVFTRTRNRAACEYSFQKARPHSSTGLSRGDVGLGECAQTYAHEALTVEPL